jgi:hypothetical protein
MKLNEIINPPANNLTKLYLDMHDGDAIAANTALQNDLKAGKPLASLVGKKPTKPVDKNNMRVMLQNAQAELQKSNQLQRAAMNLQQLKKEHGVQ